MARPRKTYYRINSEGEIEKVRRTIPPEGWTTDKKQLELTLKARQVELTRVGATDAPKRKIIEALEPKKPMVVVEEKPKEDLEWLKEEHAKIKRENKKLKLEVVALRKRIEEDTQIIKRSEKDRMENRMWEIERTAEFARHNRGISEDEYYRLKQAAQGLQQQLEALKESHEELRHNHNKATSEKNLYRSKIDSHGFAINYFHAGLQRYYRLLNRLINKLPIVEQTDYRKQIDRVYSKCTQILQRMKWDPSQYDLPNF